jgi:hypothetical protein
LERGALQELAKYFLLKYLDDFEFASSLELESFDLRHLAGVIKHGVPLFQHFVFFLGGWNEHASVWTVYLEED